ncbi:MAG: superoxide dismutase, Ni [Phycisphaerales bacterium]|nr:superoxide dismutase, Ni [Phycisphaerales bacterium]
MNRPLFIIAALSFLAGAWFMASQPLASAHCQIPCGIYDDPARVAQMKEDALTIRKAVTQMAALMEAQSDHPLQDFNQGSRWVMTKDQHAQNIQDVASYYFLTQRVKAVPAGEDGHDTYMTQLAAFHRILVAAMKCKQTVDVANVDELDAAIAAVAGWYTE